MSFYIKFGGLALLLVAAISVVRGYREYVSRRISEQESFISLLLFIKGKISRYLTPIPEIIKEFKDENLSRVGFFEEMASGKSISEAFENVSGKLAVGKEFKEILRKTFAHLGVGYKEEVLSDVDDVSLDLEKILSKEKESLPKDIKVFSAVMGAGVLGIFILLV